MTCYRLGLRVGEPQLPALLVSHRRPGFYMRVLTEGQIQAGDAIVKVASGPERLTVAEVDGLLYLHDHPRDDLARALRVDALSPGWKASLAALLEQADAGGSTTGNPGLTTVGPPPAWEGFRPLRVAGVDRETATVSRCGSPRPTAAPCRHRSRVSTSRSGSCSTRARRSCATTRSPARRAAGSTASA